MNTTMRNNGRTRRLDGLVAAMHAYYMAGRSLAAVGRIFNRDRRSIREMFERRGLHIRPVKGMSDRRRPNGQIAPFIPATAAQIDAMIEEATKVRVPLALKLEWRHWSLEERGAFIERLRAKVASPNDRPVAPFSANVEPFDYSTPRAHEIAAHMNAGRDSRYAAVKLDAISQGVIYQGELWFWSRKVGYQKGPWTAEHGRPCLHRLIWEEAHGRPVPEGYCVTHLDGNRNNLSPDNLGLLSRNENARRNQAAALNKKSRAVTALLLNRSQYKSDNGHLDTLHHLKGL